MLLSIRIHSHHELTAYEIVRPVLALSILEIKRAVKRKSLVINAFTLSLPCIANCQAAPGQREDLRPLCSRIRNLSLMAVGDPSISDP